VVFKFLFNIVGAVVLSHVLGAITNPRRRVKCPQCGTPIAQKRYWFGSPSDRWNCDHCQAELKFDRFKRLWRRLFRNTLSKGFIATEFGGRLVRLLLGGTLKGPFLPLPVWAYCVLWLLIAGAGLIPDTVTLVASENSGRISGFHHQRAAETPSCK
jgi:hypothetical protein